MIRTALVLLALAPLPLLLAQINRPVPGQTPLPAAGASVTTQIVFTDPPVASPCAGYTVTYNWSTGAQYGCVSGAWQQLGGTGTTSDTIAPSVFGSALTSDLKTTAPYGVVRVVVMGDSLSRCDVSTCGSYFPQDSNLWVNQMTAYLQSKYGNHGTGFVPFRNDAVNNTFNGQWLSGITGTMSGCPVNTPAQVAVSGAAGANGPGQMCFSMPGSATVASKLITFDHLNLYYQTFNCSNANGIGCSAYGFDLKIDSNDLGNFGTQNTGCCIAQTTNVAAPLGAHAFVVTQNPSTNANTSSNYMMGFEGVVGSTGVSVDNLASAGGRTEFFSSLNTTGTSVLNVIAQAWAGNPHTWFVIMTGTNDFTFDSSNHTGYYLGGILTDLITTRGIPASHVLIVSPPMERLSNTLNVTANDQMWFKAQQKQVARSYGVAYLDLATANPAFASYAAANDLGYHTNDGIHLTDSGTNILWQTLKTSLGL